MRFRINTNNPNPASVKLIVAGSGTDAGPLSSKATLSSPFELSVLGSPFRNSNVVEALVAVNDVVNSCHVR